LTSGHAKYEAKELQLLTELAEQKVLKPVIDRVYNFEHIVEAHRYVDEGHKKGNVALRIQDESS
jgi:NADPH:quinone reductase-like Zn-dependent oxidoreductase